MGKFGNFFTKEFPEINFNDGLTGRDLTTVKVGGKIPLTVFPKSLDDVKKVIRFCKSYNLKYKTIGNGSNIIFSDNGFNGVIISTENLNNIEIKDDIITAYCGVKCGKFINFATENNLGGFEHLVCIPATIGGMTKNNAGAFDKDISTIVEKVFVLKDDEILTLNKNDCVFSYRKNKIDGIILKTEFCLFKQNKKITLNKIKEYSTKRSNQPKTNTCGSVFVNPKHLYIAKMIESCKLKGYKVGGISVSERHANFIINDGTGTCMDVLAVVNEIRKRVYNQFGIIAETEIEFVGE